jgi:hypothetical protein
MGGQTYSTTVGGQVHVWDVARLWSLAAELPVQERSVASLEEQLDHNCWFDPDEPPTVRRVVEHVRRIAQADFQYPIILSDTGEIMDGMHRLAKAWADGLPTVKVVLFEVNPSPDRVLPRHPPRCRSCGTLLADLIGGAR